VKNNNKKVVILITVSVNGDLQFLWK